MAKGKGHFSCISLRLPNLSNINVMYVKFWTTLLLGKKNAALT